MAERGVEPWQAAVIGDRLDEEIAAGRAVGAWTVRVLGGQARFAASRGDLDRPHYTVGTLEALPAVIEEIEKELAETSEDQGAGAE
ncbi:HAD hydrolase-like protein [Myxococcota bacterium]|nr:HAD hydrolase-like protein [Myxococcota bacterium]